MLAIGLAITQEKGDGQTFQVSSGKISKPTGDHFHAFLLPEYCVHPLESDYNKRKWGDREGHSGRWLGYVDSTKVIFSFRRKRKSISPDVRMIPFTRWSGNLKRRSARKYVSSVEAPKELQPLWSKKAGGMKEYQCLSSENLNQRKQRWQQEKINLLSFVDNIQRSIVLFDVVT